MNKKRYIIFLITIILSSYNVKSQIILVLGQKNGILPQDYLSSGQYYYKDVYNYLDNFVGTWEYANGNEKFQIILDKKIKYHVIIPKLKYDYYKDGVKLKYKKFINTSLIFESPDVDNPDFKSVDGYTAEGYITDYGRIAKTVIVPKINRVLSPGGYPLQPNCTIELLPTNTTEPKKLKFHLYYWDHMTNYDSETYAGQPIFSIPNDIVMTKVE